MISHHTGDTHRQAEKDFTPTSVKGCGTTASYCVYQTEA